MNCPKCNHENAPDAQICSACGSDLAALSATHDQLEVKTCKTAVVSCILALLCPGCFLISIHAIGRRSPQPSLLLSIYSIVPLLMLVSAIVFGIIAFYQLATGAGRLTGRGFAAIGITLPLVAFFLAIALYVGARPWSTAYRLYCGTNLSGIGKAMLIYAGDYDDEFPRQGTYYGAIPYQTGNPRPLSANSKGTITSNFYLLVKSLSE